MNISLILLRRTKIYFIVALVCLSIASSAQDEKSLTQFFKFLAASQKIGLPLYYTSEINSNHFRSIMEDLKNKKLIGIDETGERSAIDTVHLSDEEWKYLNDQMAMQTSKIWRKPLLKDWYVVEKDTVNKLFRQMQKPWELYDKYFNGRLYSFSKPVFFRGNTLCLFYFGYDCGSRCGFGDFGVYELKDGEWKYKFTLSRWIS